MRKFVKKQPKLIGKLKKKLSAGGIVINAISNQRHLSLIRDTFATMLPLIIVSGFAIIFITVVFGGWNSEKSSLFGLIAEANGSMIDTQNSLINTDSIWRLKDTTTGIGYFMTLGQSLFNNIYQWGIGLLSVFVSLAMGYTYALQRRRNENIFYYIVTSFGAFVIATKGLTDQWGATSILSALIVSIIAAEIFHFLEKNPRLILKLPAGVPPAVARGYSGLLPLAITGLIIGGIQLGSEIIFQQLVASGSYTIQDILTITIQQPFLAFAQSGADVALLFIYVLMRQIFWFFGIHGENTMQGVFGVPLILLWIQNLAGGHYVFTSTTFDIFINAPAIGIMMPLSIILFARHNKELYSTGKFTAVPAVFTITEPFVFGVPVIFNVKLLIPWLLAPLIGCTLAVIAVKSEIVNPATIPVPFTTPLGIGAFLATAGDWRALVLALLIATATLFIYAPFWKFLTPTQTPKPTVEKPEVAPDAIKSNLVT